ncbi:protein kinase domain-containing protein [Streptomyces sp. NRRL S-118]|uniref:protein kinase domain-containing protein n=1 Tax=Streptomyces sp. NRRL S-118 TaxID=1463881 RepID=UPI0006934855|nr:protein kinase [Streptomyces sp. NRRL S-118]
MQPLKEQDPDRIADYRFIGRLGEGGMGVVYLARSPRGRMVAVKTIRTELAANPDFRLRFAKETALARQVGGAWTAAVLDADPDAELPWVATAYVAGPTLHQVVAEQHGPLPEHSVRGLASGLCQALGDIHAASLVHRDLKPSNVLVTIDGPKVIDFGIARALDSSSTGGLTSTGVVVGSPGFMSPEQIRGESLTEASDIFSLGTVLAFAASGRLPFNAPAGQLHALMYRVVHEPPDLAGVPEPLLPLIKDCLAKNPADRPTLAELRDRERTQHRSLTPWLPPILLARLGQEAVQLLDQEDPRTRMSPGAQANAEVIAAAGAVLPKPLTAPLTELSGNPTGRAGVSQAGPTKLRLADERRRARSHVDVADGYRVAVYWLLALVALTSVLTVIHQLTVFEEPDRLYPSYDRFPGADDLWGNLVFVDEWSNPAIHLLWEAQHLFGAALVVCWLIWFARVRATAEKFAPGRLRYRSSMAVIGWFIPLANLFLPKQIANDVWHASSPPGMAPAPARVLNAWWTLWLATFLTWPLFWTPWTSLLIEHTPTRAMDASLLYRYEFGAETWFSLIAHVLVVPASAAAALYIRRLTAMQAAKLNT